MLKRPARAISLWEVLVLVAGAAAGLALLRFASKDSNDPLDVRHWATWLFATYAVLVGMSMVVACLLLCDRWRTRRRWKAGAFCWFCLGLGAWCFAPMIVLDLLPSFDGHYEIIYSIYFFYVLPLLGLVVTLGAVVGLRPARGWYRGACWWPECFGMAISILWAIAGVISLGLLYLRAL